MSPLAAATRNFSRWAAAASPSARSSSNNCAVRGSITSKPSAVFSHEVCRQYPGLLWVLGSVLCHDGSRSFVLPGLHRHFNFATDLLVDVLLHFKSSSVVRMPLGTAGGGRQ